MTTNPPPAGTVTCPSCGHQFTPLPAARRVTENTDTATTAEARINGQRSFDDIRELVRKAVGARLVDELDGYCWAYIVDLTDTDVVYMAKGDKLYQCTYTLSGDEVTLGEEVAVERTYTQIAADAAATETVEATRVTVDAGDGARVLEAKGTAADGGRIFRVRIIRYGESKNPRRYSEAVMRKAAPLYNGAAAYNHHRTEEEMRTGTIVGLAGYYRNVEAAEVGIEADLHLLPSAKHEAEALDAALKAAKESTDGNVLVGISHDVYARWRTVQEGGRQIEDAIEITAVNSADIVSTPAAGGEATRVVAGGLDTTPAGDGHNKKEPTVPPTLAEVLGVFKEATDEQLAEAGLARAATENKTTTPPVEQPVAKTTETDDKLEKSSYLAKLMISSKVLDADLPTSMVESVAAALPKRITESEVDAQIAAIKTAIGGLERAGLAPTVTTKVTAEAHDKKVAALDAFFDGNFREGYRSFRHAFFDISGAKRPGSFDEDENRMIMRESIGAFDSARRSSESLSTPSWDAVLGDSIHRRMIKVYGQPSLQNWRQVVSDITPVSDFRDNKRERIGGYGLLPTVAQGAPYQPLQSPGDEEAVYAVIKRGGTEDLTFEMIANDDMQQIRNIPRLLGLAAAITLYRFVWDIFQTNAATSYDATALFHANHNNTAAAALSQSALDASWVKMRQQTAYGNSVNILSLEPKTLIVPTTLGPLGFQLTRSAVAIPAAGNDPADRPNMYEGMGLIVIDYWTDQNDWFTVADPQLCPTIEVGFYQGREDPEIFTQADPTVGSMFDADKLTYKIRHIYSGAVLEHRGLQRNTA